MTIDPNPSEKSRGSYLSEFDDSQQREGAYPVECRDEFLALLDTYFTNVVAPRHVSLHEQMRTVLGIADPFLTPTLAAVPEATLGILMNPAWSTDALDAWNLSGALHSKNPLPPRRVLLAHSLSPMGDSVFLLADLGRACRIAAAFGLPLEILLADRDWSRRNWNVADFGEANLGPNLRWRVEIYKNVGAVPRVCNLANLPSPRPEATPEDLEQTASNYVQLVQSVLGPEFVGRRIAPEERPKIRELLQSESISSAPLLKVAFIAQHLRPEIGVVTKVLDEFRQFDHSTFLYFLAQRYHQFAFADAMKVAILREKSFDEPFFALDSAEFGEPLGVSRALYFSDYLLTSPLGGKSLTIHPYCFPSGSAYTTLESFKSCLDVCIHLDDLQDGATVARKWQFIQYPHSARLMADILSFAHFFSWKKSLRTLRADVRKILASVDAEWAHSWVHYSVIHKTFQERVLSWAELFSSRWSRQVPIPYYFFPFLFKGLLGADGLSLLAAEVLERLARDVSNQVWDKTLSRSERK